MGELKEIEAALYFKQSDKDDCKIARHEQLIVIADKKHGIIDGKTYWCKLSPMRNDNGYVVVSAIPYKEYKNKIIKACKNKGKLAIIASNRC
jgi:hypothetical protein